MNSDATTQTKLNLHIPQDAREYINLVEMLSSLVDQELLRAEADHREGKVHDIVLRLPAIISTVNTIGYLRGEDGMFLDFRPEDIRGTSLQKALYVNQDAFELRLQALIDFIGTTEEAAFYRETLERYYITARTARTAE